jgi:hypothetical protein
MCIKIDGAAISQAPDANKIDQNGYSFLMKIIHQLQSNSLAIPQKYEDL